MNDNKMMDGMITLRCSIH